MLARTGDVNNVVDIIMLIYMQEFWDWSWQDLAMYDLAEMIQYLYSISNSKIFLVGHSQVIIILLKSYKCALLLIFIS